METNKNFYQEQNFESVTVYDQCIISVWNELMRLYRCSLHKHSVKTTYNIISYDIIPYHIISYHIISYHIISYHHITSYHNKKHRDISYHITTYHYVTHRNISCLRNMLTDLFSPQLVELIIHSNLHTLLCFGHGVFEISEDEISNFLEHKNIWVKSKHETFVCHDR